MSPVKELRYGEANSFISGDTASEWQSRDLNQSRGWRAQPPCRHTTRFWFPREH